MAQVSNPYTFVLMGGVNVSANLISNNNPIGKTYSNELNIEVTVVSGHTAYDASSLSNDKFYLQGGGVNNFILQCYFNNIDANLLGQQIKCTCTLGNAQTTVTSEFLKDNSKYLYMLSNVNLPSLKVGGNTINCSLYFYR